MIFGFIVLVIALMLADRVAPVTPKDIDDVKLSQQVEHSLDLGRQEAAPIAIPSQRVE